MNVTLRAATLIQPLQSLQWWCQRLARKLGSEPRCNSASPMKAPAQVFSRSMHLFMVSYRCDRNVLRHVGDLCELPLAVRVSFQVRAMTGESRVHMPTNHVCPQQVRTSDT